KDSEATFYPKLLYMRGVFLVPIGFGFTLALWTTLRLSKITFLAGLRFINRSSVHKAANKSVKRTAGRGRLPPALCVAKEQPVDFKAGKWLLANFIWLCWSSEFY